MYSCPRRGSAAASPLASRASPGPEGPRLVRRRGVANDLAEQARVLAAELFVAALRAGKRGGGRGVLGLERGHVGERHPAAGHGPTPIPQRRDLRFKVLLPLTRRT